MKTILTLKDRLILILIIFISYIVFIISYNFNNKYTHNATQAANGLLIISEDDLNKYPLRFLCQGWEFYPNVLLSSKDFISGYPKNYMNYISIGEYTHFNNTKNDTNPHGSGTYVLNLKLPKEINTYALYLPEIFSAYELYIDDKLLLKVGNPNPNNYKSLTQNRIITFEKANKATIIISVSDFSHFYSGIVYPPVFGTIDSILLFQNIYISLCLIVFIIGIIVSILSLYLGLQGKQKKTLLFSLLCIAMCGFTSYPILHTFFSLSIFPWYALEITCNYAVTLLVIVLHNDICGINRIVKSTSNWICGLFCIISLCYGLFSANLNTVAIQLFSNSVFYFKLIIVAYLLITSYFSIKVQSNHTKPLFYASILYACSFAWDRILPTYEPIYGGWFSELSSIMLVISIGYMLWKDMVEGYIYSFKFAEQHRQMSRQLDMQIQYSQQISKHSQENRKLVHDFRQHIRTINVMIQENNHLELLEYLKQTTDMVSTYHYNTHIAFCSNIAIDALLKYYYAISKEKNIEMNIRFSLPKTLPINDVELCTILGNLLENAIEACDRQEKGKRNIFLNSIEKSSSIFILLENTFDGKVHKRGNKFLSRKSDMERSGIGLESSQEILNRYNGTLDIFIEENKFKIGIFLPI